MNTDQNWYRQLLALILLSASKTAVEYITNPGSREVATGQLRAAFQDIDYEALANAMTKAIDSMALESKGKLNEAIDNLRDQGISAVDEAKNRAQEAAGKKKGGKLKFFFALLIGGVVAYFVFNPQRRDELMDRLTGASGPIEPKAQNMAQQASQTAQSTVQQAENTVNQATNQPGTQTQE